MKRLAFAWLIVAILAGCQIAFATGVSFCAGSSPCAAPTLKP